MKHWVLTALLSAAGCSQGGVLVARNGEHRWTARDPQSGVTVVLTTGVWQGEPQNLAEDLTVMHVLVANHGTEPLLLAPGDLELRDLRGFHYDLLDTGATFYRLERNAEAEGPYAREYRPDYDIGRSENFELLEPFGDAPALALPWGVLEPGTQMRGFLYFEPLVPTANGARLLWHLGTPAHQELVQVEFDLYRAG